MISLRRISRRRTPWVGHIPRRSTFPLSRPAPRSPPAPRRTARCWAHRARSSGENDLGKTFKDDFNVNWKHSSVLIDNMYYVYSLTSRKRSNFTLYPIEDSSTHFHNPSAALELQTIRALLIYSPLIWTRIAADTIPENHILIDIWTLFQNKVVFMLLTHHGVLSRQRWSRQWAAWPVRSLLGCWRQLGGSEAIGV